MEGQYWQNLVSGVVGYSVVIPGGQGLILLIILGLGMIAIAAFFCHYSHHLQKSKQKWQSLFEKTLDAILIADDRGYYVEANPAACELFGLPKEQLIGKSIADFTAPGFDFERGWQHFLATGQQTGEFTLQLEDGSLREVEFVAKANFIPGRHLSIVRNVTDRKDSQAALIRSERLYRTLTRNFPNGGVLLFDQEFRFSLAEGLGLGKLNEQSWEGKTLWEVFDRETCQILIPATQAALKGTPTVLELPRGEDCYLVHILPVRNESEGVFAGMMMWQDISDRKRMELALLEERNFVSAVLDTADVLVLVLDPQGRLVRLNRACQKLSGYSIEEIQGRYAWEFLLVAEEIEKVKMTISQLQGGQFFNKIQSHLLTKDGERRLISWSNRVLLDGEGAVKFIIGTGIDITEQKKAEEMRLALEREQEINKLQLHFFAMASHEFRTPLSTILMSAQLLEQNNSQWLKPKGLKNIQRIQESVKHTLHLLEDILMINRADSGRLELNFKPIDTAQFCQNLMEELQLGIGRNHHLHFADNLPELLRDRPLNFDGILLRSILLNLLSNGINYSPLGTTIQLEISAFLNQNNHELTQYTLQKYEQSWIIFTIEDEGPGIPLGEESHIFEPFYRCKNVEHLPGSGLGLTVVKKCVNLHQGQVTVTTTPNHGTVFKVRLPLLLSIH